MSNQNHKLLEVATLGGGCFWCLEAAYHEIIGVEKVISGYAGGTTVDPCYEEVSSGKTGHAEVVQITYDTAELTYD
ncbi:peptide-methionine (S)-S-oxide reductase, partial [Vibrio parahaemolyticus]